jgi:hypothetical protein
MLQPPFTLGKMFNGLLFLYAQANTPPSHAKFKYLDFIYFENNYQSHTSNLSICQQLSWGGDGGASE